MLLNSGEAYSKPTDFMWISQQMNPKFHIIYMPGLNLSGSAAIVNFILGQVGKRRV